jgi:hypothetical protein
LDITKLLLEELEVAAAIAHLRVETGSNGFIVCLGPHRIGSVDEGLLPLYLLVDVVNRVIVVHSGGGCAMRCAGRQEVGGGKVLEDNRCQVVNVPKDSSMAESGRAVVK